MNKMSKEASERLVREIREELLLCPLAVQLSLMCEEDIIQVELCSFTFRVLLPTKTRVELEKRQGG